MAEAEETGQGKASKKAPKKSKRSDLPPPAPQKRRREGEAEGASKKSRGGATEEAAPQTSDSSLATPLEEKLERRKKQRQDLEAQSSVPPSTASLQTSAAPAAEQETIETAIPRANKEGTFIQRPGKGLATEAPAEAEVLPSSTAPESKSNPPPVIPNLPPSPVYSLMDRDAEGPIPEVNEVDMRGNFLSSLCD